MYQTKLAFTYLLCTAVLALAGCGGGGSAGVGGTGEILVSVVFPGPPESADATPEALPVATNSVRIRVLSGDTPVVPDTIIVRGEPGEPVTATIEGIPAGVYVVEALGYESYDGTGDVIAQAIAPATVVADQTTQVRLITVALVVLVDISPCPLELTVGQNAQLTATCYDADGNVVLAALEWSSDDPAVAEVSGGAVVTQATVGGATVDITAVGEGTCTITAYEPVSGKEGVCQVTVGAGKDFTIEEAMAIAMAADPNPGSQANVDALMEWEDEDNIPSDADELQDQLNQWANAALADPDDTAAQLGLTMAILGTAGHNGATYLGYNIFQELDLQSVSSMGFSANLDPANLVGDALDAANMAGVPRIRAATGQVRPMADDGFPPVVELQDWQVAIQTDLLPALENAYQRMVAIADVVPPEDLLLSGTTDGETYNAYAADYQAIAGALQLVRCAALMAQAVNPNYGSYKWDLDMIDRDADQDGMLTVAEYAPPAPFGDIDQAAWQQAGACLRDGIARLRQAIADRQPGDPDELVMRALEGEDVAEIDGYLGDAAQLLAGQQNVTIDYANWDEETQAWVVEGSAQVPVDLGKLWDNPPASFRSLLPPLYIGLGYGKYDVAGDGLSFILDRLRSDLENIYFRCVEFGDPGEEFTVAISWAPHHLHVPANVGLERPEMDLEFNWDWSQFTGIAQAAVPTPISGYLDTAWRYDRVDDVRWDEIPDRTLTGVFPNPDQLRDLAEYDHWTVTYGTFDFEVKNH